jgi:hypothetical protein
MRRAPRHLPPRPDMVPREAERLLERAKLLRCNDAPICQPGPTRLRAGTAANGAAPDISSPFFLRRTIHPPSADMIGWCPGIVIFFALCLRLGHAVLCHGLWGSALGVPDVRL